MPSTNLLNQKCRPLSSKSDALSDAQITQDLVQLSGWSHTGGEIRKTLNFKNYYETIGFVNAIAYIANREDHHPDLEVGYNKLTIRFSTHSVGGISINDFICAAKIDALLS
jgi:4a-hydroxytetrahydrobiopterin dehydratase